MPVGEVLFEAQTIGYEFFIILRGTVGIYIPLKQPGYEERRKEVLESADAEAPPKKMPRFKSKFEGVPKSPANPHSIVYFKEDGFHVFHKDVMLKEINSLSDGTSFGEVAIMGKDSCTRNATIFCKADCYFAVLDKANFQRIIGEHTQRELQAKVAFLSKVTIFSLLSEYALGSLIYFLVPRRYNFREPVILQGRELKEIILIRTGRIRVFSLIIVAHQDHWGGETLQRPD